MTQDTNPKSSGPPAPTASSAAAREAGTSDPLIAEVKHRTELFVEDNYKNLTLQEYNAVTLVIESAMLIGGSIILESEAGPQIPERNESSQASSVSLPERSGPIAGVEEKDLRKAISNMLKELRTPIVPSEYFPAYDWLRCAFEKYKRRRAVPAIAGVEEIADLLDALEFSRGAIVDAIACEDGLDGNDGLAVVRMIDEHLTKHGRNPQPLDESTYKSIDFSRIAEAALAALRASHKAENDVDWLNNKCKNEGFTVGFDDERMRWWMVAPDGTKTEAFDLSYLIKSLK